MTRTSEDVDRDDEEVEEEVVLNDVVVVLFMVKLEADTWLKARTNKIASNPSMA
jgi:hypothetical protein